MSWEHLFPVSTEGPDLNTDALCVCVCVCFSMFYMQQHVSSVYGNPTADSVHIYNIIFIILSFIFDWN